MDGRLVDIILVFFLLLIIALRAKAQENVEIHSYAKDGGKLKREAEKCTSFQDKTKFIDKQLTRHVIFNASIGDTSILPCVQWCLYITACKAVSFYKPNKQCIMYNVDSTLVADQEFEDLKGSIFSDISLWPASLVGSCQSRPCFGYEMCLPVLQNYACINIDCGPLPRVPFSTNNASGTTFGSVVEYTCVTGFVMKGPAMTSCMANRKWTSTPECQIGHIGETSCMDNNSAVIDDSRTCNEVFGTGCACVQGKCLCTEAGYIPNAFNIACVKGYLRTTVCETTTNLVKGHVLTCGQSYGTGSTCVQERCVCSEAGYVPNLTNTACVQGYLGSTICMDETNIVNHDTRTCAQSFGTGSTCVQGNCVCSEAGYVPNLTNTACIQGYLGTTNCMDVTNVISQDTRTCEQSFGTGSTCVQGKCVCSKEGYVPKYSNTACERGYLGTTSCEATTNLVTNYPRTCEQVFGATTSCYLGKCECRNQSYVPNLTVSACVQVGTSRVLAPISQLVVNNGGQFGYWGDPQYCSPGTFAVGYSMKIEVSQSCLYAIRLFCSDMRGLVRGNVTSLEGQLGDWVPTVSCTGENSFLTSFKLHVREYFSGDICVISVKFRCRDFAGNYSETELAQSEDYLNRGGAWGSWSPTCNPTAVICGLKTKVLLGRGLNDVVFYCCDGRY